MNLRSLFSVFLLHFFDLMSFFLKTILSFVFHFAVELDLGNDADLIIVGKNNLLILVLFVEKGIEFFDEFGDSTGRDSICEVKSEKFEFHGSNATFLGYLSDFLILKGKQDRCSIFEVFLFCQNQFLDCLSQDEFDDIFD